MIEMQRQHVYFQLIKWLNEQGLYGSHLFNCKELGFALIRWGGKRWKVNWFVPTPIPPEVTKIFDSQPNILSKQKRERNNE